MLGDAAGSGRGAAAGSGISSQTFLWIRIQGTCCKHFPEVAATFPH